MTKFLTSGLGLALIAALTFHVAAQQVKRSAFDVKHYVMDVNLSPVERKMNATVDVTFTPLEDARAVAFELNGALKVDSVIRLGAPGVALAVVVPPPTGRPTAKPGANPVVTAATPVPAGPQLTFVQDQTNSSDLGPHVRVDLGETVSKGTTVTLRFKYGGILDGPAGGPLLNKRLASVGEQLGYLMYAARWFPFHDYAADPATSDISITLPAGLQIVGFSDQAVSNNAGKYRFVQATPALIGNFVYGKFTPRTLHMAEVLQTSTSHRGSQNLAEFRANSDLRRRSRKHLGTEFRARRDSADERIRDFLNALPETGVTVYSGDMGRRSSGPV